MHQIKHGSLFSGIGGFDLAAQWAGFDNIFQVEIDSYCNFILEKHFPNVERYKDIREFNGKKYEGAIDVISGGFPCQPFSLAGKKRGKNDDRYIWDEMLRVIQEVKPEWVLAENVYGLVSNENGMALEKVLADMESQGFQVQTFIIPAVGKNAPHRRDRTWIIANSESNGNRLKQKRKRMQGDERYRQGWEGMGNKSNNGVETMAGISWERDWLEVASELCRVHNGIPNRVDRIKALGNAIVPEIAFEFFTTIVAVRESENSSDIPV